MKQELDILSNTNETVTNLKERALKLLETVGDPEMPAVSLVDLGMIDSIDVYSEKDGYRLHVKLLPTFAGCPALDMMRRDVEQVLGTLEKVHNVSVEFVYTPKWTTDRIKDQAKEKLKTYGIAPPPCLRHKEVAASQMTNISDKSIPEAIITHSKALTWHATCPYCGSNETVLENPFGPTSCRSIFYCKSCKNPFEAMKPVG